MSRFCVISCEVFRREMAAVIARSPHTVEIRFLPKGLHDIGCVNMRQRIQAAIDAAVQEDPSYDAVLLGYGLCNHGLAGIEARRIPLVLPRAHDCMTLFLGSKERYLDYHQNNPGVYFKTTGWMENRENGEELSQLSIPVRNGMGASFEELVARYGEENARYLQEELCQKKHYNTIAFIEMGVEPPGENFQRNAEGEAIQRGWRFRKITGDLSLLQRLVDGDWRASEFLLIPPGERVAVRYDEEIVRSETAERVNPL